MPDLLFRLPNIRLGEHELHTECTFKPFVAQIDCSRHITVDRHARQHTGEYV